MKMELVASPSIDGILKKNHSKHQFMNFLFSGRASDLQDNEQVTENGKRPLLAL